jgi:hypothetical protein
MQTNQEKFSELKKLNLTIAQYIVTGSGALGIRNLRTIGDIDLMVTPVLWDTLAEKYGISDSGGVQKIILCNGLIEAMQESSFTESYEQAPTLAERIAQADIIEGLAFESLEHVLFFKRKMGREKDLKDVRLIENWMVQCR